MDMDNKTTADRLRELAKQSGGWQAALINAGADDLDESAYKLDLRTNQLNEMADKYQTALGRLEAVRKIIDSPIRNDELSWTGRADARKLTEIANLLVEKRIPICTVCWSGAVSV